MPYFSYALTPGFNSITAKFFDRVVLLFLFRGIDSKT
eukprot:COSAG01_NODE_73554_length_242_cov_9.706294_1_plen_36_part_01